MRIYRTITDRKIRMALVGCGRISGNHFGAMEQHAEHVEIADVCDVDGRALERAVQRTGAKGHSSLTEMLATSSLLPQAELAFKAAEGDREMFKGLLYAKSRTET